MPFYPYACRSCPAKDLLLRKFEDRPETHPCPECGGSMRETVAAPTVSVAGRQGPREGHRPEQRPDGEFVTTYESATLRVREKGSSPVEVEPGLPGMIEDWFPIGGYHDNGLGRFIHSKAHRRQVMEELGVIEGWDTQGQQYRQMQEQIRAEAENNEVRGMLRGMEHGDDAPGLKKARDHGLVPDWTPFIEGVGGLD